MWKIIGSLPGNYTIGVCCSFTKPVAFRSKSKEWLPLRQDNMS